MSHASYSSLWSYPPRYPDIIKLILFFCRISPQRRILRIQIIHVGYPLRYFDKYLISVLASEGAYHGQQGQAWYPETTKWFLWWCAKFQPHQSISEPEAWSQKQCPECHCPPCQKPCPHPSLCSHQSTFIVILMKITIMITLLFMAASLWIQVICRDQIQPMP